MAKRKPAAKTEAAADLSYITPALRQFAVPIDSVTEDPLNPNSHGEGSIEAIAASLAANGQLTPIVVREQTGIILSGNGRHAAAKKLGWTHIAAIRVPFDSIAAARYAIADNRSAEFSEWNVDNLTALRTALDEENAWDDLAETFLLDDLCPPPADEEPPPAPSEPIPERYQLVVTVPDRDSQEELFRDLNQRGYKVRVLTT